MCSLRRRIEMKIQKISFIIAVMVCFCGGEFAMALPDIIDGPVTNPANGHAYFLLTNSTWTDAEAKAIELGGHLVTIDNAEENTWVCETLGAKSSIILWNGLNDVAEEGTFVWASGDPVVYSNWNPGEPNNKNGIEDYTLMHTPALGTTYGWNDLDNWMQSGGYPLHGVVEIPEPATMSLLVIGGLALLKRKRK
jgi:hypothetical protein